jgi:thiamine kinase
MTRNPNSSRTSQIIQTLVNQGLLTDSHHAKITKLTGGYHNFVYRLRHKDGVDWVIKQYATQSNVPLFPALPDHESGALKALDGSGVTPKFIGFLPKADNGAILIYEFVKGEQWQDDTASVARMLAQIHKTNVHQAKTDQPFRLLPNKPNELTQQTQSILDRMQDSTEAGQRLDQYMVSSDWSDTVERCIIHTDCGPGNIVVGHQGPVLIDWQCPGMGDPIEDLINFSSPSMQILYGLEPLSDEQLSKFLEAYNNPGALARIKSIGDFYRTRFIAYCFYREESLRLSQPDVSRLYRKALTTDLSLMNA